MTPRRFSHASSFSISFFVLLLASLCLERGTRAATPTPTPTPTPGQTSSTVIFVHALAGTPSVLVYFDSIQTLNVPFGGYGTYFDSNATATATLLVQVNTNAYPSTVLANQTVSIPQVCDDLSISPPQTL